MRGQLLKSDWRVTSQDDEDNTVMQETHGYKKQVHDSKNKDRNTPLVKYSIVPAQTDYRDREERNDFFLQCIDRSGNGTAIIYY